MRVGDRAERLEPAALVPILSLAALLRWEMLGARSLWFDEGYSLFVAGSAPGAYSTSCTPTTPTRPGTTSCCPGGWMSSATAS